MNVNPLLHLCQSECEKYEDSDADNTIGLKKFSSRLTMCRSRHRSKPEISPIKQMKGSQKSKIWRNWQGNQSPKKVGAANEERYMRTTRDKRFEQWYNKLAKTEQNTEGRQLITGESNQGRDGEQR